MDNVKRGQPAEMKLVTEAAGFSIGHTGGGCLAYVRDDGEFRVMLTDEHGTGLPETTSEKGMFGVYAENESFVVGEGGTVAQYLSVQRTLVAYSAWRFKHNAKDDKETSMDTLEEWLEVASKQKCVHQEEAVAVKAIIDFPAPTTPKPR
jgi:hypothetical protein